MKAVEQAITEFSRPFIASRVNELLRCGEGLIYDFDLTGQAVSATSTTYPEARFDWMNDSVQLGYQLARVCLLDQAGERIWLAGFHHPGDMVSVACWNELVHAAETQTHIRPRRRTELVQHRLANQLETLTRLRRLQAHQQTKVDCLRQSRQKLIGQCYHAEQQLTDLKTWLQVLEADNQSNPNPRPIWRRVWMPAVSAVRT